MDVRTLEHIEQLSVENMIAYVSGNMTPEEIHLVSEYLKKHPYEKEAVLGLSHLFSQPQTQSVPDINFFLQDIDHQLSNSLNAHLNVIS